MSISKKSRITPAHLLSALDALELQRWTPQVEEVARECEAEAAGKAEVKAGRSKRKLAATAGKSQEELQAQQQEKFRLAREKMRLAQIAMQQEARGSAPPASANAAQANLASLANVDLSDLLREDNDTTAAAQPPAKKQKIEIAPPIEEMASSTYGAL
jgi:hypothetical protein